MPSLKPRTAPPRSWPILRSFLVPKISTTTSSTISQCQMLSPPMVVLLLCSRLGQHSTQRFRSTDDVHMQMHHILPADPPRVNDGAIAVGRSLLAGEPAGQRQNPPQHAHVFRCCVGQRCQVLFRHEHEMHRRLRVDVVEAENLLVLVHFTGWYLASGNLAEYAGIHSSIGSGTRLTGSLHPRRLLLQPRDALAPRQFGAYVSGSQPVLDQHDQAVKPQVRDLGREAKSITVLGGHDRLGRLLA